MKLSERWLREWVDPNITSTELMDRLTMAGLEIESSESVAREFTGIIVAEVVETSKHPDADKLRVCLVLPELNAKPLQIVCGASNVRPGLKVALAQIGAEIGNDFKIKKAKLRGVESEGMLCSSSELGLTETSEGILELPLDAPVGMDLREFMQLDDNVIEISITPNRGDCLSVLGVAREVSALTNTPLKNHKHIKVTATGNEIFPIKINATEACPRYVGRIIRNIDPLAQTPLWMKERLRRAGIRHLSPVVDVTNYVMLELGQPLHAFDLDKLKQNIIVRRVQKSEKLALLNGQTATLNEKMLVIADQEKPLAVAGVMGGEASSVTTHTQNIFLESAFFHPDVINGVARQLGINTDSAYRFERGVDPALAEIAIERATELLVAIVGGEVMPINEAVSKNDLPKSAKITLQKTKIEKIVGLKFKDDTVVDIFRRLQLNVHDEGDHFRVEIPSYRFDLRLDVDLIEEIVRLFGYEKIPTRRPHLETSIKLPSESKVSQQTIRQLMKTLGYQEAVSYSFIDKKLQHLLDPDESPIELANPISADMSVMRTQVWQGLVKALAYNVNRQQERVRLFETGLKFYRRQGEIIQESMLAGLVTGTRYPVSWNEKPQAVDFYDIKGDLEQLLCLTNHPKSFIFKEIEHKAWHQGQAAEIVFQEQSVGHLAALNPKICKALDLDTAVFVFELSLAAIGQAEMPHYQALSKYPSVRRDIAVVVDEGIPAHALSECIHETAKDALIQLDIFDVYQGPGIETGKKSMALAITLQNKEKTFAEEDIQKLMATIIERLKEKFRAALRD